MFFSRELATGLGYTIKILHYFVTVTCVDFCTSHENFEKDNSSQNGDFFGNTVVINERYNPTR